MWGADFFARRLWLSLPLGIVAVGICALLAARLTVRGDPTEQLPQVSPEVIGWIELSQRFDAFNALLVGLEEPNGPFTVDGLGRLKRITDRLTALKADGVLSVTSLTNVGSIHEGEDGSLETEPLVPRVPESESERDALSRRVAADAQVSGALISRDLRGYLIVLRGDPRRSSSRLSDEIRRVVEEERGSLRPAYFGAPFFTAAVAEAAQAHAVAMALAGLAAVGLLAFKTRRRGAVELMFVCSAASVLVTAGLVSGLGIGLGFTALTAFVGVALLAMVAFSRGLDEHGLQRPLVAGLVAVGVASAAMMQVAFFAAFAAVLALGVGAIVLVGVLLFGPIVGRLRRAPAASASLDSARDEAWPWWGTAGAVVLLSLSGVLAAAPRIRTTPQAIFEGSEVSRWVGFFDAHFGGSEFLQLDFRGDLHDPAVASRLMRLTDLLEGSGAFADVRSVSQVLGLLSRGFGGVHRIPASRESLTNLWFFLEGRPDVRNLVSEKRDEAMVMLRVSAAGQQSPAQLKALIDAAVTASIQTGSPAAKLRLKALGSAVSEAQLDEGLRAADPTLELEVGKRLHQWLSSGESPYQPSEPQWVQLQTALSSSDPRSALRAAAASFAALTDPAMAAQLVDSILSREHDLRLAERATRLATRLYSDEAARIRAEGVIAELLEPPDGAGAQAEISVSGMPAVARQMERDFVWLVWNALVTLLVVGSLVLFVFNRSLGGLTRSFLQATLAAVLALGVAGRLSSLDPGSVGVVLFPALASLLLVEARPEVQLPRWVLVSAAVVCLPLIVFGPAPLARFGFALAAGCCAVAAVGALSAAVARRRVQSG